MSFDEAPYPPRSFREALAPDAAAPLAKAERGGTHRAEPVAATLARLTPRLAEFGITRVARITGFDRAGIEVITVARPNARGLSVANGKGTSLAAAKVSGIMEGIERWHAERPALPLRFGTPEDVAGLGAVTDGLPRVRRDPVGPAVWAPALDLATGASALVPFELVHTCWLAAVPEGPFFTSTNGLASGSHPVEAALHGLCEVIERDACALFDRLGAAEQGRRRIDPGTVDAAEVAALGARLEDAGLDLALWDATSDAGVPVVLAALVDRTDPRTPPGFGAGCHPARAVAALRAITEAAQTRLITITGTRDDLSSDVFAGHVGARYRFAVTEGPAPRRWSDLPDSDRDDIRADLAAVVAALPAGTGPALAVDLSREPGLSVVRVVVPGLEAGGPAHGVLPGPRAAAAARILA